MKSRVTDLQSHFKAEVKVGWRPWQTVWADGSTHATTFDDDGAYVGRFRTAEDAQRAIDKFFERTVSFSVVVPNADSAKVRKTILECLGHYAEVNQGAPK